MDVRGLPASNFLEENGLFETGDLPRGELGEFVVRVLEKLGEKEAGDVHDGREARGFMKNIQKNQSVSHFSKK